MAKFSKSSLLTSQIKEESEDTITTKKASINKYSKENSKNYGTYGSDFLNCTEVLKSHKQSESLKLRYLKEEEDSSVDVYENHSRKVYDKSLLICRRRISQIYRIITMMKILHWMRIYI